MITGAGKTSAVRMDHPPPLPKKPNVVSVHGGGPLPIPSKGIRRPPPAVPARFTRAAAASLTTDGSLTTTASSSSSATSTSSSDGTITEVDSVVGMHPNGINKNDRLFFDRQNGISRVARQVMPPQIPSRSSSYVGRPEKELEGAKVESKYVDDRCAQQDVYSNVSSNLSSPCSSGSGTLSRSSKPASKGVRRLSGEDAPTSHLVGEPSAMYSFQAIGQRKSDASEAAATSTKIEEALKQISSSSKAAPMAFGHSRVDSSAANSLETVLKLDPSPWDEIVETWIKENEDQSNVSSSDIEAYRRSHKNPFLADLNPDGSESSVTYKPSFTNSFSFCVDSPSTSVSNGSTTDSTTSTGTVVEGEKRAKISIVEKSGADASSSSADEVGVGNGFHIDANVFKRSVHDTSNDKS